MKKLLLVAAAAFIGLTMSAETAFLEQDRSTWTVTGCSQHGDTGAGKDGGYAELMDGNVNTFWHSQYDASGHPNETPHYLIIDRGEANASTAVGGFGFLPRQSVTGNGFVTGWSIYVTDDISGIATAGSNSANGVANITDAHVSINTWMGSKTATKEGNFSFANGGALSTKTLQKVVFDSPVVGRYVVFVITATDSQAGANKHGNCAEFYLYGNREVTNEDIAAAKSVLNSAIAAKEANLGTTVGTYSLTEEQVAAVSAAKDVYNNADATYAQIDAAVASVNAIVRTLNMPVAGHFYRIQNVNSGKYIENVNTSSRINVVDDVAGNTPGTVLYYDGSRLVSYSTGLVLGKFLSAGNKASWQFFDKDATDASANIVFAESATAGKYTICPSDGRYIYGAGTQVDCGSGDENNGYRWTITEVTWLPVYFGDAAETTIYSPVALNLGGRAKAHTLYANTEAPAELVKTEVAAIEPNTPYLLTDHTTNTTQGWNATTKCVYLQVNDAGAAAAAENPNALSGSIYATQKASGKSYFTLGTESEDAYFLAHSADYVPGFSAHYAVAADAVVAEGKYKVVSEDKKTTGISEVVAGGENGAKVIYDLQGRRVANASKGIFIINGVKTLVK